MAFESCGRLTIFASDTARAGKTLLARAYGGYLKVTRQPFVLFDLDDPRHGVGRWFPDEAKTIHLARTGDQMRLFDTILKAPDKTFLIDVPDSEADRFFRVVEEIGFMRDTRDAGIDTAIMYIPSPSVSSLEAMKTLRARHRPDRFITVRNLDLGDVLVNLRTAADYAAMPRDGEIVMPALSAATRRHVDQPEFTFQHFLTRDSSGLPAEVRAELCDFIERVFGGFKDLQLTYDVIDLKRRGVL